MASFDPRFAERAAALIDRGEVVTALSLLLTGVKAYPSYATGYILLGRCYDLLGKPRDAVRQYMTARQLVPGLPAVQLAAGGDAENGVDFMLRQLQQAKVKGEMGAGGPPEAAGDREPPVPEYPVGSPIVSATLAEIYVQQGRYREAVDAYSRLIEQRPAEAGRHRDRLAELQKLLEGVDEPGEA